MKDDTSLAEVQELVRKGEVDVKETDCDGNNILHKVCSLNKQKSDIVEYLISVGATVNQVNSGGCTALIVCASKGYLDTLRVLLKNGACVNPHGAVKRGHDSAVLAAVKGGHEACVTELIKHRANIWYENDQQQNVFLLACSKGLTDTVKYCLEHGKASQIRGTYRHKSALIYACENGQLGCLRILLSDPKLDKTTSKNPYEGKHSLQNAIHVAAKHLHKDCVLELLDYGAQDDELVMIAVNNGWANVLRRCLNMMKDDKLQRSDREDRTVLMIACEKKQSGCLKVLLKSRKLSVAAIDHVSRQGFTALMYCAQNGFKKGLKLLLQYKASVDHVGYVAHGYYHHREYNKGNSALLLAAESKHEECVKILIDHGPDIWYQNNKGQNLLILACAQGLLDTVRYCLSKGSFLQVTDCDSEGNTALFHAYKGNKIECMKELLSSISEDLIKEILMVRETIRSREKLLHVVCKAKVERPDVVELLLSHATIVDTVDSEGYTPLMICAQKGHLETMKLLIKSGASLNTAYFSVRHSISFGFDCSGNTAVMMAAKGGHEECVLELIDKGADIWHLNSRGESLLSIATIQGLSGVVRKHLDTGKLNRKLSVMEINKALLEAVEHGQEECALEIIASGADIWYTNEKGRNTLMAAADSDLESIVKYCVSKGKPEYINRRDKDGMCALIIAIENENYDCARQIPKIENPTESEQKLFSDLLWTSVLHHQSDRISFLVSKGVSLDVKYRGNTALEICVQNGDIEMLQTLFSLGAVATNSQLDALVIQCVDRGKEECVSELISQGANITCTNKQGQTLLMIAAERGLLNIVRKCLEMGSETYVNMVDTRGRNAVICACESHQTASLKEIIESGKCSLDDCRTSAINVFSKYSFSEGLKLLKGDISKVDSVKHRQEMTINLGNVWRQDGLELSILAESGECYEQEILRRITDGENIWSTNEQGQNLLMVAVHKGLVNVVKQILTEVTFEQLHATDQNGNTAIMLACSNPNAYIRDDQSMECLAEILRSDIAFKTGDRRVENKYCDIDAEIYGNNKSLMHFVCSRDKDWPHMVEALIKKHASSHTYDVSGLTPLMVCARKGHLKSLTILLRANADPNARSKNLRTGPSHSIPALEDENSDEPSKKIKKIDPNATCRREQVTFPKKLHTVSIHSFPSPEVELNDSDMISEFSTGCIRRKGKDYIDTFNNTSIHLAAMAGHDSCVQQLIAHGADIWSYNSKGENLLMLASAQGLWKVVEYCLDHGSDDQINRLDINGNNAVIHACKRSPQINALNILLKNLKCSKQVNALSRDMDMTPLMLAAFHEAVGIMKLLLENGADPNQENVEGLTSIFVALGAIPGKCAPEEFFRSERCHPNIVTLLLEHGADVKHVCKESGESVLIVATANTAPLSIVEELLKRGANVNHTNKCGHTALQNASMQNREGVVKLLLRTGASLNNILQHENYRERWTSTQNFVYHLLAVAGLETDRSRQFLAAKDGVIPKLYDMCRIPARQHVMNSFPNSNLFCTIPRLVLPQKMKDFLLFDVNITENDAEDICVDLHMLDSGRFS